MGEVLLVTAAAGAGGTGLGGLLACLLRRDSSRLVSLLLNFAAGVMTAVVCFDLLADAVLPGSGGVGGRVALAALGILAGYGATGSLNAVIVRRDRRHGGLFLAGVIMAAAIALHNVPEGMAVAVPLVSGGMGRARAALATAATGLPTVLGAALGYSLGTMGPVMLAAAMSFASGAMLYVVFGELLPEAARLWESHLPALAAVVGMIVGMMIVYL